MLSKCWIGLFFKVIMLHPLTHKFCLFEKAMHKVKSVAIYVNSFHCGGVEWAMYRLALGLRKRGHKVNFVIGQEGGELSSLIRKDFEVFNLNEPRTFRGLFAMAKFLKERKPDILISNLITRQSGSRHCTRNSKSSNATYFSKPRFLIL